MEPPREMPPQPKRPDAFQERILKGDLYMAYRLEVDNLTDHNHHVSSIQQLVWRGIHNVDIVLLLIRGGITGLFILGHFRLYQILGLSAGAGAGKATLSGIARYRRGSIREHGKDMTRLRGENL